MSEEIEYEVMDVEDVRFLKERIRELETNVSEMQPKIGKLRSEIEIRDKRIAKAREILEASSGMEGSVEEDIQRALEALEGK